MKKILITIFNLLYPVAVFFAISFGVSLILHGLGIDVKDENIVRVLLVEQVLSASVILWIYHFQSRRHSLRKYHYSLSDFGLKNIFLIMVITYLLMSVSGLIIIVLRLNELFPKYTELVDLIGSGPFLLQLLAAVLMAPILEEVLCRGIIFSRMREISGFWVSALVSSLIWAAMHLNVVQGITTFLFGIFLAFLYEKFKMLIVPILCHGLFKLIGETAAYYDKRSGYSAPEIPDERGAFVIALIIAGAILLWLIRALNRSDFPRERKY
jgi:membrane protease YdiL (CAAX protease family)